MTKATVRRHCYILALLLSLFSCINEEDDAGTFELRKGDPLPSFTISNEKETVSAADLQNKITLIIFFSTTCKDCLQAMPEMNQLYNTYKDHPSVRVLLIARGQTEKEVQDYLYTTNCFFDFFADPDRKVYSLFADNTIPRLFLSGKDGKIILTQTEYVDGREVTNTINQLQESD